MCYLNLLWLTIALGEVAKVQVSNGIWTATDHPRLTLTSRFVINDNETRAEVKQKAVDNNIQVFRERRECTYAHTIVRQNHGDNDLIWDEELAYEAELWAIYLASEVGTLQHSSLRFANGSPYGENLYEMDGLATPSRCCSAVFAWYNEIHNYDFDDPVENGETGHFTQLVWSPTRYVGVGAAYSKATKKTIIATRYTPPGNFNADTENLKTFVKKLQKGSHIPTEKELLPSWARPLLISDIKVEKIEDPNIPDCVDKLDCSYYVSQGDCKNSLYESFMMDSCYKSCTGCKPGAPVNGGWTKWCDVNSCSVSCGGGVILYYRFCASPYPKYGGKKCIGPDQKTEPCNTQPCPGLMILEYDKNDSCPVYADKGYCYAGVYMSWMQKNCRKSCAKYLEDFWMADSPSLPNKKRKIPEIRK